jgi:ubiquinone biosynthesis protein UbiJ
MKRPLCFNPDLALFFADTADVRERLDALNQRLLAILDACPTEVKQAIATLEQH